MRVFYYQFEGRTYLICVRGNNATSRSQIWRNCNTSVWIVPGTEGNE